MNYLLYNPKANNSRNDINIIDKSTGEIKLQKVSLLTIDMPAFLAGLTDNDKVYICGGDGTLNKFANNTYGFEFPCPVYLVGGGTGNDFLRDIEANDGRLVDFRPYMKDLPVVTINGVETRFLNGIGFGVDGAVCEEADQIKERSDKKINYLAIAIGQILHKFKRPTARVTFNGKTRVYKNVWFASAMKGRFYGGGMMVAPTQDRMSGLITASIVHGGTKVKILTVLPKVYKGTHVVHTDMVDQFPVEEMKVTFDIPTALQIDGDTVSGVLSYTVRTAKKHEEYMQKKQGKTN